ncbi:hypothetical protein H6771_00775 [Candidatus Peribacteria bacterium]|nr:hypothetical protein [Candidatus Peribacteria bacterium]
MRALGLLGLSLLVLWLPTHHAGAQNEIYNETSLTRQLDRDGDGTLDENRGLDPRTLDEIWFPSWQSDIPRSTVGTGDAVVIDPCNNMTGSGLSGGNQFVCGVIGKNFDGMLVMNFFNRFADLLLMFLVPLLLFFVIQSGVRLITVEEPTERARTRKALIRGIIGLLITVVAYSVVKTLYFFLTQ